MGCRWFRQSQGGRLGRVTGPMGSLISLEILLSPVAGQSAFVDVSVARLPTTPDASSRAMASMWGVPDYPILFTAHPMSPLTRAQLRARAEAILEPMVAILTGTAPMSARERTRYCDNDTPQTRLLCYDVSAARLSERL
jgi:hypothetical protein